MNNPVSDAKLSDEEIEAQFTPVWRAIHYGDLNGRDAMNALVATVRTLLAERRARREADERAPADVQEIIDATMHEMATVHWRDAGPPRGGERARHNLRAAIEKLIRSRDERALAGADEVVREWIESRREWLEHNTGRKVEKVEREIGALLALLRERAELRERVDALVNEAIDTREAHRDELRRACERVREACEQACLERGAGYMDRGDVIGATISGQCGFDVRALDLNSLLARDAEGRE